MITQEQLSAVLHHPVYGRGGQKIGEAKHVFFDDATGRPEWVTVKTGLLGGNESFVPIRDAVLSGDHLEVPYTKEKVKTAPNVDVDAGGHLSAREEHTLYDFYGVERDTAARGPAGPAAGQAAAQTGQAGQAAQTGQAGQSAQAGERTAPQQAPAQTMAAQRAADRQAEAPGQFGTATDQRAAAGRTGEAGTPKAAADAMTLSEEEMRIRVDRRETGRVRLRKYVVTEERQQNIPLRHEEARVIREPITEANREEALSGPDIAEAEHVVILHEETPVIETTVEPKERVRLTVDEHTEQKTVRGRVRKERVKLEDAEEEDRGGMGR